MAHVALHDGKIASLPFSQDNMAQAWTDATSCWVIRPGNEITDEDASDVPKTSHQ
jgi:hypothetical protein